MKYLLFLQSGHTLFRSADLGEVVCFGFPEANTEEELATYAEWEFSLALFDSIMFDPKDINLTNCKCCQSRWNKLTPLSTPEEVIKKVGKKYTVIYTLHKAQSWVQSCLNRPEKLQTIEEVCTLMYRQRQRRFFDEMITTEDELPHGVWSSYSKMVPSRLLPISPSRSRHAFVLA